jgi:Uma2 family endonuclease
VTRAPHWGHQKATTRIANRLDDWSLETGLGEAVQAPGIIFSDADNVIPDVVWISHDRLTTGLDESGHLIVAPDLIVEVLSAGTENERRDREAKLKLYSERGVQEYWIINCLSSSKCDVDISLYAFTGRYFEFSSVTGICLCDRSII